MKEGMIGLEIHTYLVTKEKLFCSCINSRKKGVKPNTNVCPICTGQPGSKPMAPLEEAVFNAVQIGLLLGCKISDTMHWQRKHYDWPDLPKGYQITLSGSGAVPLGIEGNFKGIRIRSMHLEEDPAAWDPETGEIDYNRSGLPLVEIVTEPDFTNSSEVVDWLTLLLRDLSYLGIADSDAGIKVDVNVNIPGKTERVEIKNVNSIETIGQAIEVELERQEKDGQKTKETRRFNTQTGKTERMRSKEDQEDYRFIRDPDLPYLILDDDFISSAKNLLPEMPENKKISLIKKYGISEKDAEILVRDRFLVEFYENIAKEIEPQIALSWVSGEILRLLNANSCNLKEIELKPEHFIALLKLVQTGQITPLKAKEILKQFYPKSFMPDATQGRITDKDQLRPIVEKVIKDNKKVVEDYRGGNENSLNFLLGCVMRETGKRADNKTTKDLLLEILG